MAEEAAPREPDAIAAALRSSSAQEREAAGYAAIEQAVRAGSSTVSTSAGTKERTVALAVACVRPLFEHVLCAPASRVGVAEYTRASLLLHDMQKLAPLRVCGEMWRHYDEAIALSCTHWTAADTVVAQMLAKQPGDWDASDAVVAALSHSNYGLNVANTMGIHACWEESNPTLGADVWIRESMEFNPFVIGHGPVVPLQLRCLELLRSQEEADADARQPEAVVAGLWRVLCDSNTDGAAAKAVFEAGFVEVAHAALQHWNPIERISKQNIVASAILTALKDCGNSAARAGVEIVQPLLDAGIVDIILTTLTAYQMLGPDLSSVVAVQFGALEQLKALLHYTVPGAQGQRQSKPIAEKVRSAGCDAIRYVLDHPLTVFPLFLESGPTATRIAAMVRKLVLVLVLCWCWCCAWRCPFLALLCVHLACTRMITRVCTLLSCRCGGVMKFRRSHSNSRTLT
jgi:hypothetical protein